MTDAFTSAQAQGVSNDSQPHVTTQIRLAEDLTYGRERVVYRT
jgi:hypothetical protein